MLAMPLGQQAPPATAVATDQQPQHFKIQPSRPPHVFQQSAPLVTPQPIPASDLGSLLQSLQVGMPSGGVPAAPLLPATARPQLGGTRTLHTAPMGNALKGNPPCFAPDTNRINANISLLLDRAINCPPPPSPGLAPPSAAVANSSQPLVPIGSQPLLLPPSSAISASHHNGISSLTPSVQRRCATARAINATSTVPPTATPMPLPRREPEIIIPPAIGKAFAAPLDADEAGAPMNTNSESQWKGKSFSSLEGGRKGGRGQRRQAAQAPPAEGTQEYEHYLHRVQQRTKQIALGKQTDGYINYIQTVRREARDPANPLHVLTPRADMHVSKRCWDALVRSWRRTLHVYDPESTMPPCEQSNDQYDHYYHDGVDDDGITEEADTSADTAFTTSPPEKGKEERFYEGILSGSTTAACSDVGQQSRVDPLADLEIELGIVAGNKTPPSTPRRKGPRPLPASSLHPSLIAALLRDEEEDEPPQRPGSAPPDTPLVVGQMSASPPSMRDALTCTAQNSTTVFHCNDIPAMPGLLQSNASAFSNSPMLLQSQSPQGAW